MAGLNKLIIIGNLGRDPEMRYMPNGSPVTNFSVAVSRRWTSRDGEQKEETDWFNVSCFDKMAETANQYLTKGRQVYIEGQVRARLWDDQQSGEKRVSMDVRANQMVLLGQRSDQGFGGDQSFAGETATSRASADATELDNMPF